MSATFESPAAAARPARRSIHTALLHGSEDKEGDDYGSDVPRTEHVVSMAQRGAEAPRRDPGAAKDAKPDSPREAPIQEWTVTTTMGFLEEYGVTGKGLEYAMQKQLTGATIVMIVEDTDAHQMLAEQMAMSDKIDRLKLMAEVKKLTSGSGCKNYGPGISSRSTDTIPGEKKLGMPIIPKGIGGRICTNSQWKVHSSGTRYSVQPRS